MNLRILSIASIVCVLVQMSYSQSASKIYSAQFDDAKKLVYSCNLDGSGRDTMSMPLRPRYLAVDWQSSPGKLYVGLAPMSGIGKIIRCNVDGTDVEDVVTNLSGINDIELDLTNRRIFWLQNTYADDRIFSADMDGLDANVTQIYATTVPMRDLWGLALDVQNQRLWITERGSTCYSSYIRRMTFSGSGVTIIKSPVCNPHDIEYHDGEIFWGEEYGILKASADGSGVDTLVSIASIVGLALDGTNHRMYWSDYNSNNIKRADFDGTNEVEILGSVGQFSGIDTDYNPSAVPVEHSSGFPRTIELYQNYPNPFNAETVIRFHMPRSENVKVSVYDLYGREVVVLAEGTVDAGVHQVRFDALGLSAGVYFCRLQAEGAVQTRKLLLLK